MKAMDTNKLILRLERLMTSLPVDPVKRRAHEQSVVTWLPEDDVKLCPNCAKSFNITRQGSAALNVTYFFKQQLSLAGLAF